MTEYDLLVIDQRDFMERRTDLCIALLRLLCRRPRQTSEHVEGALFERLDVRLARTLIRLTASTRASQSGPSCVRISQNELASLLDAARESVNKQLHAWQRAGLVDLRKREIAILDPAALKSMGREAARCYVLRYGPMALIVKNDGQYDRGHIAGTRYG